MYRIPKFLKPKVTSDLIRIGSFNDGGYVIPKNAAVDTDTLISFGLFDDWKFEEDFKKFKNCKIICYDHSVTTKFWIIRFIKNCYSILLMNNIVDNFKKFFTYFKYLIFFNKKDVLHLKKFIAPKNEFTFGINNKDKTDLNEIFSKNLYENIFLKIDIEGSEYRILDQIILHQNKIKGAVVEFHSCDLLFDRIEKFISNFDLDLIHIHVNNYSNINQLSNPDVIELTFCQKKYSKKSNVENLNYPMKDLDSPNNKNEEDPQVSFY
jgi:hypothetical protein